MAPPEGVFGSKGRHFKERRFKEPPGVIAAPPAGAIQGLVFDGALQGKAIEPFQGDGALTMDRASQLGHEPDRSLDCAPRVIANALCVQVWRKRVPAT